jgi:hypothetical protein
MRIFMPNETLKEFHPPIKYDDNFDDNGIGGVVIFPILHILMGFLNLMIVNFVRLILTSYFFILIISSNLLLG